MAGHPLRKRDERGMALVLVLLVLSVLTAMVVEFAYGIYVNTSLLTNWQRLQEISLAAESGVSVAAEGQKIRKAKMGNNVKDDIFNVRELRLPQMDPFGLGIGVELTIVDEHSKFNINKIEKRTSGQSEPYYEALKRLFYALELKDVLAEAIRDHMYGIGTEKTEFKSVEELLLVAGVDREVYNILSPYVTVFGNGSISVNTAEKPVLMALALNVSDEMAETAVQKRPFGAIGEFTGIQGFASASSLITVKGETFSVISKAMDKDGLTREIHCVLEIGGKVLYWREL